MRASHGCKITDALPLLDLELHRVMPSFVTCRIQNCYSFTAHVTLLAPSDHEVWEQHIQLAPGMTRSVDCPTGFLIVSVFDLENDALCMCRASHVSGSFTLLLS
jgi:hypothetical protein